MLAKTTITQKILYAMIAGLITGSLINTFVADSLWVQAYLVQGLFKVIGTIFINGLKMLVVPLVTFSLLCGVCGIGDVTVLGRIGFKAFFLYLLTTALAITLALSVTRIINPGQNFSSPTMNTAFTSQDAPPLADVFINIIPGNPVQAFAEGNMLQIIFFVILFGIALLMTGEKAQPLVNLAEQLNEVMMKMVNLVMDFAPIGVFFLMARTFSEQGIGLILPLLDYFLAVVLCLLLHGLGTFSLLLIWLARLNPIQFLNKIRPAQMFAFSTASSNATIPVTLQVLEQRIGVDNTTAAFTVPLGATINMDGTAIMQGVATVFIANVYHIDLTLTDYITVITMSILASIGTAGVPGVGLIMLAMVLSQVGLPVEGIGLILGVDRLLDMMRTVVNITGDATVTSIVARSENTLNDSVFKNPQAGVLTEIHLPHKHHSK